MRLASIFCILLLTVSNPSSLWGAAALPVNELASELLTARLKRQPIPNVTLMCPMEMSGAYRVQNAYIQGRLNSAKLAGFKAGLTSSETQAHFSVARPVFGALFSDGDLSRKKSISLQDYRKMMIETELGFITKKPIRKTVESVDELKSHIAQIVPVIELPEIHFASHPISGIDLVAANCAANVYIVDRSVNWMGRNLNNITVTLLRNGKIVNQGQGSDALGDQWEALRWLVNQILYQGWYIDSGFLLITGVLGEMTPAQAGAYKAQFNEGTVVQFNLVA